jgi:glycosyltransferase involved in cell wall biosynthesis
LDGIPVHPTWKYVFEQVTLPFAMTEWALNEYMKAGINMAGYIHHGVNWNWFTRSKESYKKARRYFRDVIDEDTVVFMEPSTNQYRKRVDALLECWRDFRPETKKAKLFLNMDSDMTEPIKQLGWNLEFLMEQLDVPRETVILPEDLYKRRKYFEDAEDVEFHKFVFSIADIVVSCTSGEGFGKTLLEALSMGIPVIAPNYSAIPEVCEKGSILVPLYDGPAGYYRVQDAIRSVYGGIVNQEKFVDAMTYLYHNKEEREELGAVGREWAKHFDYDTQIIPSWMDVLTGVNPDVIYARELLRGVM